MARPKSAAVSRRPTARDASLETPLERLMDNDDDMEFHMTFPSPGGSGPLTAEDYVFLYQDDVEPVVFLLGWGGCQDHHLAKYSSLYEERGCITVRYTVPIQYLIQDRSKIEPIACRLVSLLEEMCLQENPVFIHSFSNNGATVYQFIREEMKKRPQVNIQLQGVIFDSGPGQRRISSLFRAVHSMTPGPSLLRIATSLWTIFLVFLFNIYHFIQSWVVGGAAPAPWCWDYVMQEEVTTPTLFLYSTSDKIVNSEDIEEIAVAKEKAGREVMKVCYEDTEHVAHLRLHRESYVNALVQFIQLCQQK